MWAYRHTDELYHHGIKGMKWGVRNGPPYPLKDKGGRSAAKQSDSKKTRKVSANDKKVKGVVDVVAVTAALTLPLAISYVTKMQAKKATEKILNSLEKSDIKSRSDLPKINGEHSIEDDMAVINPKYTQDEKWQSNCSFCAASYELRRRGFDVAALPLLSGVSEQEVEAMYKGVKVTKFKEKNTMAEMTRIAESWGEGARGSVITYFGPTAGHIFSVEVKDGKAVLLDPQSNTTIENGRLTYYDTASKKMKTRNMVTTVSGGGYFRTDNVDFSDKILKTVKKREG